MRIRASFAAVIVVAVVAALFAQDHPGVPRPSAPGPALDEISADGIAAHIRFLSDDLLEGRAPSFTLPAGSGPPFKYLQDVVAFSGLQDPRVSVEGELVFVGHGVVAPSTTGTTTRAWT